MAAPVALPTVNVGMVGHVDHGKTTLTQALTGKWTDTHSEEVKRGITIRLGYADVTFFQCPQHGHAPGSCCGKATPLRTVSIVDAPGHETLMTTMLAGAAIMDGALLVISATEKCPQPQTREHLQALDIVGIRNIVVVQNKVDLVSAEQAREHHLQIKAFLKGSVAEKAPIIPVSAQHRLNMDLLIDAIEQTIPTPRRDPARPVRMLIARSFDINRPGMQPDQLVGGVLGGSLVQGTLRAGDQVEIRPGAKVKDAYKPVATTIQGLQKAGQSLQEAGPGGLLGVSTGLDPALTKSDTLVGNVLGKAGQLPPVWQEMELKTALLQRVVGSREELVVEPIKAGDVLMLTVGISRTVGSVTSGGGGRAKVVLKIPVCAEQGDKVAISRQVLGRWRLIGWGEVQ
ncbi:MAG: translation initiation factor IF-2 subunit gamma [Candidatus Aenigmarchaeota archaeon]|nr:translation initiation factor IF-2 subunit gamma [Candidatus Aenigmarchaeota archaeon]